MECEFPSVNSTSDEIREIFANTKTIAVLGLSPDPDKASHRVAKYLKEQGFKIVPVYPKEDEILGEKVYRSLAEIPFAIGFILFRSAPVAFNGVVPEIPLSFRVSMADFLSASILPVSVLPLEIRFFICFDSPDIVLVTKLSTIFCALFANFPKSKVVLICNFTSEILP